MASSVDISSSNMAAEPSWRQSGRRVRQIGVAALSRFLVMMVAYIMVMLAMSYVLPSLAAWLHREAGLESAEVTMAGMIGLWVVPLVFGAAMMAVVEIVIIKHLWCFCARRFPWVGQHAGAVVVLDPPAAGKTHRSTSSNHKKEN